MLTVNISRFQYIECGLVQVYTPMYSASMLRADEIAEEYPVHGKSVLTPDGMKRIRTVYKTVPMPVWLVCTTGHTLRCSGHHLIKTQTCCREAFTLQPGEYIETDKGLERVIAVGDTGEMEALYDLTIDTEDGLFYANGVVSHNSTTLAARQLINSAIFPSYKSLYVVPYPDHLKTYARRYQEMELAFRADSGKQNMYNKIYGNGSSVDMIYCLTTAAKARGKSIDECISVDSLVSLTTDKKTKLCNLECNTNVISYDTYTNNIANDRTVAYISKGARPCWRLTTAAGDTIVCTANHRFGTPGGWAYLADFLTSRASDTDSTVSIVRSERGDFWTRPADDSWHNAWGREYELRRGELVPQGKGGKEENYLIDTPVHILRLTDSGEVEPVLVTSIAYAGMQEVADIQVDKNHNFFACNLLVRNCLIDESQNVDPEIIPELLYVQTTSKMPSTIYAGTALSIDTLLEHRWVESSQGMWHVRAMDGTHWLNMCDKDTLLKVCDNAQGPTCPYTGKLLDVTNGGYVHANAQAMAAGDIGIHIPQCIIPDIAYDPVQWGKIYRKIKRDDFKKVLQECFGIAVSEGSREISESDLMRLCVLTDTKEQLREKCRNGYYRLVVSGCDWGGSDYNQATKTKTSYTVHVIIGIAPDGGIDILHWRRYSGMAYPEIAQTIISEHYAFGAQAIASDFGVGMAYNMELRNSIPFDRHFIMNYVGPMSAPLAEPKGQHMPNQLSLNRTEALTNVFSDVKSPVLKIRCRCWDDMAAFLLDFLNMYRVPVEMPGGSSVFRYMRAATKADDALHAFTFAYVLAKFYMGEPLVDDRALEKRLRDVLYSPTAAASTELNNAIFGETTYVVSG